jgi:2-keto-3-deoxy-L-rhamnonate aldolase RhmA
MGIGGDYSHPRLLDAWTRIASAAKKHGKGLRIGGVKKQEDIARTYALGSRMVITGNDITTLVKAMRADLDALRASSAGY